MKLRTRSRSIQPAAMLLLFLVSWRAMYAGGPLLVGSPAFGVDGQPFVWDNSKPISYRTDGGALGSLGNSSANDLVAQSFQNWAQVPTASLSFTRAGLISGIADGDVNTIEEFDATMASCNSASQSPIIYDDGGLLGQLIGDDSVVGLAGPCELTPTGKINSAFAIFANPLSFPSNLLPALMTHEFGHFIGLDHTDIRVPFTGTEPADNDAIPTMYFQLFTPLQSSPGLDDAVWVSKLYPSASFAGAYGRITGQVLFSDGQNLAQGVLVIARAISDIHATVVAGITGYRFTGNPGQPYTKDYLPCTPPEACSGGTLGDNTGGSPFGSRNPALIGFYELPVPTGQYRIEIRNISGGEIGPLIPVFSLPGPEEYWNINESANDPDWTKETSPGAVTVSSGQTVDNINIILNGTDPAFDIFEHSQSGSVERKSGEKFPLFARRNERQ